MKKNFVSAIIAAAGSSSRMGKDKIFLPINNIPSVAYTLMAFENASTIDEIVIVCQEKHQDKLIEIIENYSIKKFKSFAVGGSTRQDSVFSGIKKCNPLTTHFSIHDAARCLITSREIDDAVCSSFVHGACSLGVPCKDTLKILDENNFVSETPDRSTLWIIQTPQVFEKTLYIDAMNTAMKNNTNYTDDCQLIEKIGKKVYILKGNYSNLKITTPDDIAIFENLLNLRGKNL